jgi:hypothetical protein
VPSRRAFAAVILPLLLTFPGPGKPARAGQKDDVARQMRFGAEMARAGNWREAIFRWQRALAIDPANPRIHCNLGVAFESLGEFDKADAEYKAALAAPNPPEAARQNSELFSKFYSQYKERQSGPEAAGGDSEGDVRSKGDGSKGESPKKDDSKGSAPKGDDSKSDDSKSGDSKSGDSKSGDSKSGDSKGDNSKSGDSKGSAPKGDDSKGNDGKSDDPNGAGSNGKAGYAGVQHGSEAKGDPPSGIAPR